MRRGSAPMAARPLAATLMAAAILAMAGCRVWPFGRAAEPIETVQELDVVDDEGPFDPSEAVDDDDELGSDVLDGDREPSDTEAFADADGAEDAARRDARSFATASAEATGRQHTSQQPAVRVSDSAPETREAAATPPPSREHTPAPSDAREKRAPAAVDDVEPAEAVDAPVATPKELPDGEHIATEQEIEALLARRDRRLTDLLDAGVPTDEAKALAARNPPSEPLPPSRPVAWQLLDFAGEGLLLLAVAVVLSTILSLARAFPRTAITLVLLPLLAGAGILLFAAG